MVDAHHTLHHNPIARCTDVNITLAIHMISTPSFVQNELSSIATKALTVLLLICSYGTYFLFSSKKL